MMLALKAAKKKNTLLVSFAAMFLVFSVLLLATCAFVTYFNQTNTYTFRCLELAKGLNNYLDILMRAESDDIQAYIDYYMDNYRDIKIKWDFTEYESAMKEFYSLMAEKHPGKSLGTDITYDELSEDVKRAHFEYTHCYWVLTFENARDAFGMSYVYFLVMGDPRARIDSLEGKYGAGKYDGKYNVLYLIDGERTEETVEGADGEKTGTGYLYLGDTYYNDPEVQRVEWETFNKGERIDAYQEWDNAWGHTYSYYTPLIVNGKTLGLIVSEIPVDTVKAGLLRTTVWQTAVIGAAFVILIVLLVVFINKKYISKIVQLESRVREFTADKDPAIASTIRSEIKGRNEISSLAHNTAEMIDELDNYITSVGNMTAEKVRMDADLNVATKIQADMLPTKFPARKELELYATMTPAKEVGGDFYDFFKIDSDHIGLVMGDVSGKGVPAALFMVVAKTLIQDRALLGRSPARVLEYANNRLCENNTSGMFVTVWLGVLELSTGKLTSANAGHEYPAIMRAGEGYDLVPVDNAPPLAAMEDMEYEDEVITLRAGDSLFLYTDGVPEAKSPDGKRFGTDKMIGILNENIGCTPEKMLKVSVSMISAVTTCSTMSRCSA